MLSGVGVCSELCRVDLQAVLDLGPEGDFQGERGRSTPSLQSSPGQAIPMHRDISGEDLSWFFRKLNSQQNPILVKDYSVKMEYCVFTLLLIEKSTQIINKC